MKRFSETRKFSFCKLISRYDLGSSLGLSETDDIHDFTRLGDPHISHKGTSHNPCCCVPSPKNVSYHQPWSFPKIYLTQHIISLLKWCSIKSHFNIWASFGSCCSKCYYYGWLTWKWDVVDILSVCVCVTDFIEYIKTGVVLLKLCELIPVQMLKRECMIK